MDLQGKSALITGASRGIGAAVAEYLASQGMALALSARDAGALEAVCTRCEAAGGRAIALPGDMTDLAYVRGLPQAAAQALGRLDVLINNAGLLDFSSMETADLELWDRILDVNFRSWIHLTHHALPLLTQHEESAVVNLCSVAGRMTFAGGGIYSGTKHAVHGWSQSLFDDVRAKGVKVCTLYPGFVNTDMAGFVDGDHAKMIQPADIARTIAFALGFPANACPTEIVIRPQFPLSD